MCIAQGVEKFLARKNFHCLDKYLVITFSPKKLVHCKRKFDSINFNEVFENKFIEAAVKLWRRVVFPRI